MKKLLSMFTVFAFMAIPAQSAFAWSYEGLNSLNPFTGFRQCNTCEKVKCKCQKRKLTKCEKLHGVRMIQGEPCGCAVPIIYDYEMDSYNYNNNCPTCRRAF